MRSAKAERLSKSTSMAMDIIFYDRSALAERKINIIPHNEWSIVFGWNIWSIWAKHTVCLGETPLQPYPVETLLPWKKKQLNRKRVGRYFAIYV